MKTQARMEQMKTVELSRGPGGFGFTLSGQAPCVLSCVLPGSPAHKVNLKPGDQLIAVNGLSVEEIPHEQVVKLIAHSSDGVVQLAVRKPLDSIGKYHSEMQTALPNSKDEDEVNVNILNRVDKVVEELKSGQLLVKSSAAPLSFPNGHFITEGEIASDEELKASFTESLQVDISPSGSLERNKTIDEEKTCPETTELSRFPNLDHAPIKSTSTVQVREAQISPQLRAVVGYLGSIELPANSNLETASLNAIRSCVRRLRAQQKVQILFLMEVSVGGVKLISGDGKAIVTYPLKSLAFTGICSDDKRVFGIVTRKCRDDSDEKRPSSSFIEGSSVDAESTTNCSCHVFCVDPELAPHESHVVTAKNFGISCDHREDGFVCRDFPSSSSPILNAINGLSRERTASEQGSQTEPESFSSDSESTCVLAGTRSSSVTSQSDSLSDAGAVTQISSEAKTQAKAKVKMRHISVTAIPVECMYAEDAKSGAAKVEAYHESDKEEQLCCGSSAEDKKKLSKPSLDKAFVKPWTQVPSLEAIKGERYDNERNDSGVGSDSFQLPNESETLNCYYNGSSVTPVVNVSTFHSRESSIDSQMSLSSHHSWATDPGSISDKGAKRWPPILQGTSDQSTQFYVSHGREPLGPTIEKKRHRSTDSSFNASTQSLNSVSSLLSGEAPDIDQRVARWAVGLDKLMDDPTGIRCFQEFLKKEYSDENISFYLACEKFREITNQDELKVTALEIFDTHLSATATVPVNIDSLAVRDAEKQLSNPNRDMFTLQQQQVYTLMKFDSYPRFLKSDLYRQCLVADLENCPLPFEETEENEKEFKRPGLLKKVSRSSLNIYLSSEESEFDSGSSRSSFSLFDFGTSDSKRSSKSRGSKQGRNKFLTTFDDNKTIGDKKKSLLPWKSKQGKKGHRGFDSQPSSARSSLSSLSDTQNNNHSLESLSVERRESDSFQFCRIVLPDRSSTIVVAKPGQMLRHALMQLCDRRHLSFAALDIYINNPDKVACSADLERDMSVMAGSEVTLEHRILFRIELPNGNILGIKSRPDQSVRSCIEPILRRHGFPYDDTVIHLADCEVPLDSGIPVASIEHQHVVVETKESFTGRPRNIPAIHAPTGKPPAGYELRGSTRKVALDDSVFDEIMRGRRQSMAGGFFDREGVWVSGLKASRSDESLAELNRGNVGSSSFGKSFLKGSGIFGRKKRDFNENEKTIPVKSSKSSKIDSFKSTEVKEFFELISKTQRNRMDDQRGELKGNLELPDFLKISASTNDGWGGTVISSNSTKTTSCKPVVRKTVSSPSHTQDPGSFVQELTSRLSRRTGSVKDSVEYEKRAGPEDISWDTSHQSLVRKRVSPDSRGSSEISSSDTFRSAESNQFSSARVGFPEPRVTRSSVTEISSNTETTSFRRLEDLEGLPGAVEDFHTVFREDFEGHQSSRSDTNLYLSSKSSRSAFNTAEAKQHAFRRRANTDLSQESVLTNLSGPGYTLQSRDYMREPRAHTLESRGREQRNADRSFTNLAPSSHPVTVNSIRGINVNYVNSCRGRASTGDRHHMGREAVNARPHGMQKHISRTAPAALRAFKLSEFDTKKLPRSSPVIYEVQTTGRIPHNLTAQGEGDRLTRSTGKIRDIGAEPPHRGVLSAYELPQPSLHTTVVTMPSQPPQAPLRNPQTVLSNQGKRPRPRPITNPAAVIASLDAGNTPVHSLPGTVSPLSDGSLSPLPPAPTPLTPETLSHLEMANFPPPTPMLKETTDAERRTLRASTDHSQFPDPSLDRSPNKTLTPSAHERTIVVESDEEGAHVTSRKHSSRQFPHESSSQVSGSSELSQAVHDQQEQEMDPYVTYERQDLRITFV